jgi:murein DD-endopeptidase MepM/ murein hydrolase activator NlpD
MSRGRWRVLVTRENTTTSRRFQLGVGRAAAWLAAAAFIFAGAGFATGYWSSLRSTTAATSTMQAAIDSLTEENAKVDVLAARIADMETNYERLREVMGGQVVSSSRDILLPPARAEAPAPRARASATMPEVWPLVEAGFVTRSFGDTVPGEGAHGGLDIAIPVGSYVRSTGSGVIDETGEDREYGRFVRIKHADGIQSLYAHNSWTFVAAGDSVDAGEVIALSGNTGRSTAPHLHLEIEQNGVAVDPLPFVAGRL